MLKGAVFLWWATLFSSLALSESVHNLSTNRSRYSFSEQGGSAGAIDPCAPVRLSAGQVPASTVGPLSAAVEQIPKREKPTSKTEAKAPRLTDSDLLVNDQFEDPEMLLSFDDKESCEAQMAYAKRVMRNKKMGRDFYCQLVDENRKVLARETYHSIVNSFSDTPQGEIWTTAASIGDRHPPDLIAKLREYACQDPKVITRTKRLVCRFGDEQEFGPIRYSPPKKKDQSFLINTPPAEYPAPNAQR